MMLISRTLVFLYDRVVKRFTLRPASMPHVTPGLETFPDRLMTEDDD